MVQGRVLKLPRGWVVDPVLVVQAVAAVIRGSGARKRYSAYVIADAIRYWYDRNKLCPRGISVQAASVQDWAVKNGHAIRKMETNLDSMLGLSSVPNI